MLRLCEVNDGAYVNLDHCVWARIELRAPQDPDLLILGLQNNSLIETSLPGTVQSILSDPVETWTEIELGEQRQRFWINTTVLESLWFGSDEHGAYLKLRFARGQESQLDEEHFPVEAIRNTLVP